jgi:hypothetical protein
MLNYGTIADASVRIAAADRAGRERLLWIVEPPLSTGEQMSVNDPHLPVAIFWSTGRYYFVSCRLLKPSSKS